MLAMRRSPPRARLPLVTISDRRGSPSRHPWVFASSPANNVVKVAHARTSSEALGKRRPAIIYQGNAYGQSGCNIRQGLRGLASPGAERSVDVAVKDSCRYSPPRRKRPAPTS